MKMLPGLFFWFLFVTGFSVYSQTNGALTTYVNPFIGTADAHFPSKWEGHGKVYPGAVVPHGYVQLTPETRISGHRGYDYADTSIYYFSCLGHASGFPGGSSGSMRIMPVRDTGVFRLYKYSRPFSHSLEVAKPGYYSVVFTDDGTQVEMTAAQRSGMFQFTYPQNASPYLFVGGMGEMVRQSDKSIHAESHHAILEFSEDFELVKKLPEGWILGFESVQSGKKIINLSIGISFTDFQGTIENIHFEIGNKSFIELKSTANEMWNKELGVIELWDASIENKTKFYTALYRSKLIPWIVSDADGRYKASDGKIYNTKGRNQYGFFSPWDTFRTLHPLLCIIDPERQNDMILSMLDEFQHNGRLPKGPMTGNHVIPIIVDSYLKGVQNFDHRLAYQAMKALILDQPFSEETLRVYDEMGYVPFTYPESVTKTVEYAYNDWVLSQFSNLVMDQNRDYALLSDRSLNYRNLLYVDALFLLPRHLDEFLTNPGNKGYKEGDQWVYSMFVPHQPNDLVNLLGGEKQFVKILDEGFEKGHFTFDNEPIFHIPYLYNYTCQPHKTQKQVRHLMDQHFTTEPGGLPGNDDLGSLSSWFVFNALGFYPFCPGKPDYNLGVPLFEKAVIHLSNGKKFTIKAENSASDHVYAQTADINGQLVENLKFQHASILEGSTLTFTMSPLPIHEISHNKGNRIRDHLSQPNFRFKKVALQHTETESNVPVYLRFSIENSGVAGTKILHIANNGERIATKNCYVPEGKTITDSLSFRLFAVGQTSIELEGFDSSFFIQVRDNGLRQQFEFGALQLTPLLKKASMQQISFSLTNGGGFSEVAELHLKIDGDVVWRNDELLAPGETIERSYEFETTKEGIFHVEIGNKNQVFKVYEQSLDAMVLNLPMMKLNEQGYFDDLSGFKNHGLITGNVLDTIGKDEFYFDARQSVVFSPSSSLEIDQEPFTMMFWVLPDEQANTTVSLFTKGDFHVMQQWSNHRLSFFAGGWGRGECSAVLPDNWKNNWHHVVGVNKGDSLQLFIDGALQCQIHLRQTALKNPPSRWHIGRNEEFPDQRIFNGKIRHVKLFKEALGLREIHEVFHNERQMYQEFSIDN